MQVRRMASLALFLAIAVSTVGPPMLLYSLWEREVVAEMFERRADPDPALAAFLAGIRERTRRGDSILLILPARDWNAYVQGYFRASYLLADRRLLPVMTTRNIIDTESVRRAEYVATWRVEPFLGGTVVWEGSGGTLVKRR